MSVEERVQVKTLCGSLLSDSLASKPMLSEVLVKLSKHHVLRAWHRANTAPIKQAAVEGTSHQLRLSHHGKLQISWQSVTDKQICVSHSRAGFGPRPANTWNCVNALNHRKHFRFLRTIQSSICHRSC